MSAMRSFLRYILSGLLLIIATLICPPAFSRAWGFEFKGNADVTYTQASSDEEDIRILLAVELE